MQKVLQAVRTHFPGYRSGLTSVLIFAIAILAALLLGAVLIAFSGVSPLKAYQAMIFSAFGAPEKVRGAVRLRV